ncbi:tetratricopeptide (TPR) repeat protein [Paenibacillus forsythiae]|uniref:Tetratricopeptide (TPR) repeat protein n=1 Tax=Paenibacillus forsythiae TaxID=365616 RepID=A0ABU3H7I8_9BACL|nr:tetratricopeptide repeat protein [Paenibacillus forsythiae]MDT3426789.1 tetratricopeptide (TPR) repeat protein [Paenibacillus forsythiae]
MSPGDYVKEAYRCILRSDFEEAIMCFEAAISADPNDPEVRYRCSITYARSGKLEKAAEHARAAVKLDGEKQDYRLHLQHLQAMMHVREAKGLLEEATGFQSNPYRPITLLKEAVQLDPLYGDAYVWLAIAHSRVNDHLAAIAAMKEVISLHPGDEGLRELMKDLQKSLQKYVQ